MKQNENLSNQKKNPIRIVRLTIKFLTTGIITFMITSVNYGWHQSFLGTWLQSWSIAFLMMLLLSRWLVPSVFSLAKRIYRF
ncbi:DUF2798 domain-containing protein [Flavobacterium soyangense]|uniref:DUF2798 domain-containing protein n=1 Tax=Flavobacterium soyangense TaxID=2023265 RepID=A0A930XV92_9FLAO|nr:DUF2798 domain-containing protein [Flavobacterium soyangense]